MIWKLCYRSKLCVCILLQNSSGLTVTLSDYGATILSVTVPQKDGQVKELTVNYWDAQDVSAWAKLDSPYYGVVPGTKYRCTACIFTRIYLCIYAKYPKGKL